MAPSLILSYRGETGSSQAVTRRVGLNFSAANGQIQGSSKLLHENSRLLKRSTIQWQCRWFLVEFLPYEDPDSCASVDDRPALTTNDIRDAIRESVIQNFGDQGWGSVGESLNGKSFRNRPVGGDGIFVSFVLVKYYSPVTHLCIIRVARDPYRTAWGGITFITAIKKQACIPHVQHVSGNVACYSPRNPF